MIFHPTELPGAVVVELERREDERGFFARFFCRREFAEHGIELEVVQANLAFNSRRGTLRGLHYQAAPHEESKLVRCVRGALYDVVVDLRPESPTFRRWLAAELTGENRRLLYVPAGVAHGYQTLLDETEAMYLHSALHAPGSERGVRWDDPAFGIEWPEVEERVISARDRACPGNEPGRLTCATRREAASSVAPICPISALPASSPRTTCRVSSTVVTPRAGP